MSFSSLIAELRNLIGQPPSGFEFLEYIVLAVLLLFILNAVIGILSTVLKWIGGNR